VQEQLALAAFRQRQEEKFVSTLLIVKSILHAANIISAATTGGNAPASNDLQELLGTLKGIMMPEYREEQAKKAEKVKEIMERESKIGSFQVQAMNRTRKRKKKGLN
jgi:hypothetical protein